jgi:2-dehydro-3-deoxyphosphogluconate aldolase/(4S)-4-hydroxy-2-oxoglutarate aldolase
VVGAGTVLDAETAWRAARSGARFVVSPMCRREMIDAAHQHGAVAVPGCFTPTEILTAWEWGADIVKVFPATALGPGYIRDVRAPLPQVKLMPTGGVALDNVRDWIAAGAAAIGVGTAMIDSKAVAADDFEAVFRRAALFVDAVAAARRGIAV